jgi:hypothetical protein
MRKRLHGERKHRKGKYSLSKLGIVAGHAIIAYVATGLGRGDEGHADIHFLVGFYGTNWNTLGSIQIVSAVADEDELAVSRPRNCTNIPIY